MGHFAEKFWRKGQMPILAHNYVWREEYNYTLKDNSAPMDYGTQSNTLHNFELRISLAAACLEYVQQILLLLLLLSQLFFTNNITLTFVEIS